MGICVEFFRASEPFLLTNILAEIHVCMFVVHYSQSIIFRVRAFELVRQDLILSDTLQNRGVGGQYKV